MRFSTTVFVLSLLAFSLSCLAQAPPQQDKTNKPKKKRQKPPVMRPIEDVEGLPRVLLIGDSISIGYTLPVRELMQGVANVHRPLTNCGPTTEGLQHIDQWLGKEKWDVIHFNWGLHDLKYMGPQGQNLADPKAPDSKPQVPIDQYERNLLKLVERLKKTNAKLIWRTTTPVPPEAPGRVMGDSARYNTVAKKIMDKHNIPIDDQYRFVMANKEKMQRPNDVHFSKESSLALARQAVAAIKKALNE